MVTYAWWVGQVQGVSHGDVCVVGGAGPGVSHGDVVWWVGQVQGVSHGDVCVVGGAGRGGLTW